VGTESYEDGWADIDVGPEMNHGAQGQDR